MKKLLSTILVFASMAAVGFLVAVFLLPGEKAFINNSDSQFASLVGFIKEKEVPEFTIFAVGDIMLDRGVELKINNKGHGDYRFPFLEISRDLKEADLLFGNLEGSISDKGEKVGSIYSFRADPRAIEGLIYAGFDVLSLANNHMLDYGREALKDTIRRLGEAGIDSVGGGLNKKEAFDLLVKDIRGVKVGFLAYTDLGPENWRAEKEKPGIAWISREGLEDVKKDIEKASEDVDVLIVSLHSGKEYSKDPVDSQFSFAKAFIESGADLVIGHHPHVIQKIEKYNEGFIAYSLGNFVFDQDFSEETLEGMLMDIRVKDKKISSVAFKKIEISKDFQPFFVKNYYLTNFAVQEKGKLVAKKTDFLEVNLPEKKIKFYREGYLEEEFSIMANGEPGTWAETPAGIYSVISKQETAFSTVAQVYMPWSINIYGKYYIHGQPYYENGNHTDYDYTGGCIRLSDREAKKLYNLIEAGTPILVVNKKSPGRNYGEISGMELVPEVSAKSYLVADLDSGFVFTEKSSQTQLPVSSITKLMTATIVTEQLDLRKSISITPEMLFGSGSTDGLVVGKEFRIVELFYPLLIESSNDAAEVLSRFLGRSWTVELMNEKLNFIGMKNTEFTSPSGFDKKNVSTVEDLFYLAQYLLNTRQPFLEITRGENVESFGGLSFKDLENKNIFFEEKNFLGGKAGFTEAAHSTGVFLFRLTAESGIERNILVAILESDELEKETKQILEWLKEKYLLE